MRSRRSKESGRATREALSNWKYWYGSAMTSNSADNSFSSCMITRQHCASSQTHSQLTVANFVPSFSNLLIHLLIIINEWNELSSSRLGSWFEIVSKRRTDLVHDIITSHHTPWNVYGASQSQLCKRCICYGGISIMSVCPSVTLRYCVKTRKRRGCGLHHRVAQCLSFLTPRMVDGDDPVQVKFECK